MGETASTNVLLDDEPRRIRAKDRLYVICQTGGWLFFLGFQFFLVIAFPSKDRDQSDLSYNLGIITMVIALGWLISHFTRRFVARWGWKMLGWRALLPRIVGISALQSFIWSAIGYGYP